MDRTISGIVAAVLLLGGCELTLEVDLPDAEPVLAVNSFFTPDSVWKVHVSDARSVVDGRGQIRNVTDAVVFIASRDGGERVSLTHAGGGYYRAQSVFPAAGLTYSLQVQAENYPSIQATDAVPEPVEAHFSYEITDLDEIESSGRRFVTAEVMLRLQDRLGLNDFYRLFVLLEPKDVGEPRRVYFEISHGSILAENADSDDLGNGDDAIVVRDAVFSDATFDGDEVELSIDIREQSLSDCLTGERRRDELTEDPCVFRAYLLHISEAFHDYASTYQLQRRFSGNPNGDPVQVSTNVENGFGIFAGYTSYSQELSLNE